MRKINLVSIDENGNVAVDYSGYEGGSCRIEEEKFRKLLAEMGLKVEIKGGFLKKETISEDLNKNRERGKGKITV